MTPTTTIRPGLLWLAIGAALLLSACSATQRCDASSCDGCCDENGQCQPGVLDSACGLRSQTCQVCASPSYCSAGVCTLVGTVHKDGGADAGEEDGGADAGTQDGGASDGGNGDGGTQTCDAPNLQCAQTCCAPLFGGGASCGVDQPCSYTCPSGKSACSTFCCPLSSQPVWTAGRAGDWARLALQSSTAAVFDHPDNAGVRMLTVDLVSGAVQSIWGDSSVSMGGPDLDVAFDPQGNLHAVYFDGTTQELRHTLLLAPNLTFFSTEVIFTGGGSHVGLACDGQSRCHVSFWEIGTNGVNNVRYALLRQGQAPVNEIVAPGLKGFRTSIAVDGGGNPHIAFLDLDDQELKYAHKVSGSWTVAPVDLLGGDYSSIAVGPSGTVHIAYEIGNSLYYARSEGTAGFVTERVGTGGHNASLAVDSEERVHVAYRESTQNDVLAAVRRPDGWVSSTLATAGNTGDYAVELGLRPDAREVVVYTDDDNQDLVLVKQN